MQCPNSITVGLLSLFHSLPRSTQESQIFIQDSIHNHKQANTDFLLFAEGLDQHWGCSYSFSFNSTPFAVSDAFPSVANRDSILGRCCNKNIFLPLFHSLFLSFLSSCSNILLRRGLESSLSIHGRDFLFSTKIRSFLVYVYKLFPYVCSP